VTAVDSGACSNLGGSLFQAKVLAAATRSPLLCDNALFTAPATLLIFVLLKH
jgi:hypothetical protein